MSLKVYQSKIAKYAGHTAGPWQPAVVDGGWDGVMPENSALAVCHLVENNPVNAALIADAPYLACEVERLRELCGELVGALEDALRTCESDMQHVLDNGRLRDVMRAALAKAKGGDE